MQAKDVLIRVHESWSGWRSAEIRAVDLEDVHWCQPSGAPHSLVHGWVRCSHLRSRQIQHQCDRASAPHRVLVCVLKRHTLGTVYADLARRADGRGVRSALSSSRREAASGPTRIVKEL
jgi:hypothetical protein